MAAPFVDQDDNSNFYRLVAHEEDVARSECGPDEAALLLSFAAEYMRNGEVIPKPLADFIAQAFERTAAVDSSKRPAELAAWLNLTAPNRRPKVPEHELGCWLFRQLSDNPTQSETAALKDAANIHGISKTTATEKWRDWKGKNPRLIEILDRVRAYRLKG